MPVSFNTFLEQKTKTAPILIREKDILACVAPKDHMVTSARENTNLRPRSNFSYLYFYGEITMGNSLRPWWSDRRNYGGVFRAYIIAYLRNNSKLHQEMTFLVRQLAPTELGLPLEIYVFSKDQALANYEAIQADIFDQNPYSRTSS